MQLPIKRIFLEGGGEECKIGIILKSRVTFLLNEKLILFNFDIFLQLFAHFIFDMIMIDIQLNINLYINRTSEFCTL